MKRLLTLSLLTLSLFVLGGCQLFQQQPQADDISETSTATVDIVERESETTSTGSLTVTEPEESSATGTLEVMENGDE